MSNEIVTTENGTYRIHSIGSGIVCRECLESEWEPAGKTHVEVNGEYKFSAVDLAEAKRIAPSYA